MTRPRRSWLPPSQQPPPDPPPAKRCLAVYRYLAGDSTALNGIREAEARCIREPWDHDGNHLADIPGLGLTEFPP